MSEFPDGAFTPMTGKLGQLIYENPSEGIAPRLEFSVEVPFEPFLVEDEDISTALWLSGICPGAMSWIELGDSALPAGMLEQIDGSVRLFGEMNPADVTKLAFRKTGGQSIEVIIEAEIDFEQGAGADYGILPFSVTAALSVDPLRVATSLDKRLKGDPEAIASEITGAVDLSIYGDLEKVPGGLAYPING